jgi:superfamily II DNA/RNA helicase
MYVSVHEHAKYSTPESLRQSYIVCDLHEKVNMLWSFIRNHLKQKILVFMASCKQVSVLNMAYSVVRLWTLFKIMFYKILHNFQTDPIAEYLKTRV